LAIAGALHIIGSPVDLARSLKAMALGSGKGRVHDAPGATLGVCDDATLAIDGAVVALFHGRLDDASGVTGRSAAEIVARAYRRWGENFAARLIGDFACAVWDSAAQRLLLARDPFAAQPLFYWRNGEALRFATEPQGLLAEPDVPRGIDETWVARWLALLPQSDSRTAYQGIERVIPGHVAHFDQQGHRQTPFWKPEALARIELPRDADYAETMRNLLDEAVRCRIAGHSAVGSTLSAGLDSSSVTLLTARQLATQGLRLTSFTAVPSAGYDGSGPSHRICDEGPLAAIVAGAEPNIDHVRVPNGGPPLFDILDRVAATAGMAAMNPVNQAWVDAIGLAAKDRGITVMLGGGMGNMSISYHGLDALPRWAQRGQWVRLAQHMSALHRNGHSWRALASRAILPALPPRLRRRIRILAGRPEDQLHQFSALRRDFAVRLDVIDQAEGMAGNVANLAPGGDPRLAVIRRTDPAMALRAERRRFGYIHCDPTADRRVVEFCLAIPVEQYLLHGESRSLVRRAMAGLLPDAVRLETRTGLQGADWAIHVNAARTEIAAEIDRLESSGLASACLDLPRLHALLRDWPSTGWDRYDVAQSYRLALMRAVATGRFLRRFEGSNA
jgi:asparagine synthase (glutamine-hydrolysing)